MMKDWEKRVTEELNQLQDRISMLRQFNAASVDPRQARLMTEQLGHMRRYASVLGERLVRNPSGTISSTAQRPTGNYTGNLSDNGRNDDPTTGATILSDLDVAPD